MKWYKKQLDQLITAKPEPSEPDKTKTSGHSFNPRKTDTNKFSISNPVAQRNRNRPKTDCI